MTELMEFETITLPTEGLVTLKQVFSCRCGVKHPLGDREIFLAHQEFAPARSALAKELRSAVKSYLDGNISLDALHLQCVVDLRDSAWDPEAEAVAYHIEWTFVDLARGRLTKAGALSALRQLIEKPSRLIWAAPEIVHEPGDYCT